MTRSRQRSPEANSITEGVIWRQLLIFFFPILLGTFFQQLYNTADAMIVGKYVGKEALAAVGGATGVLINVTGAVDLGLDDVETAANIVMEAANPEANIIFGAAFNDEFEDEMRVTVIATGFDTTAKNETPTAKPGAFSAASERASTAAPKVAPVEDPNDIDEIFKIFNK